MEPILRNIETIDWITILVITSILLLAIAKKVFYTRFLNFIILPFNNKYIFMYNKKEKLVNWFHTFFTLFQIINLSLFIFLTTKILIGPIEDTAMNPYTYLIIMGLLIIFLLLKVFLQLSNGFIFNTSKTISNIIFKNLSYLNYSAIIMFIANIILVYILKDSKTVIYISFLFILFINGIGWTTMLKNNQKFITANFFYFILYLCALEIAPFVIIGSYLND